LWAAFIRLDDNGIENVTKFDESDTKTKHKEVTLLLPDLLESATQTKYTCLTTITVKIILINHKIKWNLKH